jgi:dTDP-4-amino-4,6-dideoxygalactose transaminase
MCGAISVMADVDPVSQNITAQTIEKVLSPRTKAIICVHLAGWPCDMDPILDLARSRGLAVIEDCAQAHGAMYKGRPVGSLGDIGSFSFCQDKTLTTGGEGGMLTTDRTDLWEKAWSYKDHGKSYQAVYHQEHPPGFRWLHEEFGTNWRLTEMQSAIGRVILRKLPTWVEKRRHHAATLQSYLVDCDAVRLTVPHTDVYHSYYKYYAFVEADRLQLGWDRDRIMNTISAAGVPCYSGSCSEIYLEKAFPATMRPPERLPVAKALGEASLMFLVHPTLSDESVHYAGKVARDVLMEAARSK